MTPLEMALVGKTSTMVSQPGVYERPDEHFGTAYFGGDDADWDVISHSKTNANNGGTVAVADFQSLPEPFYRSGPGLRGQFARTFGQTGDELDDAEQHEHGHGGAARDDTVRDAFLLEPLLG